jgi:tRNA(Arg) A34 adenosine deaminase TadA
LKPHQYPTDTSKLWVRAPWYTMLALLQVFTVAEAGVAVSVIPQDVVVVTEATATAGAAARAGATAAAAAADLAATRGAARAAEIHGALDPIAQGMRTTAVLETSAGRIIAGGARDLTPAQRALVGPGEIAARLPGAHAEVTALRAAEGLGATPQSMAVTRAICPECAAAITQSGGVLTSPTTVEWLGVPWP